MQWMCASSYDGTCNVAAALSNATHWTILDDETIVDYCLASSSTETCKLQYSLIIILIVVLSNGAKVFAILSTLKTIEDEHFVTLGDAVASFLKQPDRDTAGACMTTKKDVGRALKKKIEIFTNDGPYTLRDSDGRLVKKKSSLRWYQGPSRTRWIICMPL